MRRSAALATAIVTLTALGTACGGSDEEPGLTRIDGPASVDEEILNGGGADDGSTDG